MQQCIRRTLQDGKRNKLARNPKIEGMAQFQDIFWPFHPTKVGNHRLSVYQSITEPQKADQEGLFLPQTELNLEDNTTRRVWLHQLGQCIRGATGKHSGKALYFPARSETSLICEGVSIQGTLARGILPQKHLTQKVFSL